MVQDQARRLREELHAARGRAGSPFAADAELHVINVSLRSLRDAALRDTLLQRADRIPDPAGAGARAAGRAPHAAGLGRVPAALQGLRAHDTAVADAADASNRLTALPIPPACLGRAGAR